MKKTIFIFFFLIFVAINNYGMSKSPWSEVTYSDNKEYVFVLISNGSLDEYGLKTRKSWAPLQLSSQELKEYESNLARILQEEETIRRTYTNSGLYKVGNFTNPLWSISPENTENWITRLDEKYVANDGLYVIGYNPHVAELDNDIPNKEEVGLFIYSSNFGLKSYKVSELTDNQDVFAKSMHGYFWANKTLNIDELHKTFALVKQNQKDKLEFSISNGESLSNLPKKQSGCLGLIILISIVIKLLG